MNDDPAPDPAATSAAPTTQQIRSVVQTRTPVVQPAAPRRITRSPALIGGNIRPGMVPGGFSQEFSRTSNAGCDRRLASRNKKPRQPTADQIREVAEQFVNRPRPPALTSEVAVLPIRSSPPPPPPPPPNE